MLPHYGSVPGTDWGTRACTAVWGGPRPALISSQAAELHCPGKCRHGVFPAVLGRLMGGLQHILGLSLMLLAAGREGAIKMCYEQGMVR